MISPELKKQLETCKSLPTPPGVATQIIALANDPDVDMDQIAQVLSVDPATTAKILRIANSPMYAMQRKTQNLRQALLVLGLNATISLALSFCLLKSWQKNDKNGGLDYALYWRRALLGATASQVLAKVLGIKDSEELFLTSLIQDIGVMALDRTVPDLYAGLSAEQIHQDALISREHERLGVDHADVGGWLLEKWNFPERIQRSVANSHHPERRSMNTPEGAFARCVALAGLCAEVFLENAGERRFQRLAETARESLGIDREGLQEVLSEVGARIPDAEAVFQTELLGATSADSILDEAREALMVRNLQALRTVNTLQDQQESLEQRTKQLEESTRRDPLTGLYNRAFLDQFIRDAFDGVAASGGPLSVAFADLDKFKLVNDTYGHGAGDQILVTTANILKSSVRGTDMVARYGGEEFILVFPDTDYLLVKMICERIVKSLRETRHDVGDVQCLAVTISVGMATHNDGRVFGSAFELINAADKALYTAKLQGRNRSVPFEAVAEGQLAYM